MGLVNSPYNAPNLEIERCPSSCYETTTTDYDEDNVDDDGGDDDSTTLPTDCKPITY